MATNSDFNGLPFATAHPAEIIKDELRARGMTRKEFAGRMGMLAPNVSRMLKGEDVTAPMAARLEAALGIPAEHWLALQAQYDRDVRLIAERDAVETEARRAEEGLRAVLNLRELYARLGIDAGRMAFRKIERLGEALGFPPAKIEERVLSGAALFKRSDKAHADVRNIAAWVVLAYVAAKSVIPPAPYAAGGARMAAEEVAAMANGGALSEDGIRRALSSRGIAYCVVPKLASAPIDAATLMVDGVPAIVTTHRYDDMSRLVFNVLHELGHLDLHMGDGGDRVFVASDESYSAADGKEREANRFAEDMLIPRETWARMMSSCADGLSMRDIVRKLRALAAENGLDFDIVAWRYRHESETYNLVGARPRPIA